MNGEDSRVIYYIDEDLKYSYLIYLKKMKIIYSLELQSVSRPIQSQSLYSIWSYNGTLRETYHTKGKANFTEKNS